MAVKLERQGCSGGIFVFFLFHCNSESEPSRSIVVMKSYGVRSAGRDRGVRRMTMVGVSGLREGASEIFAGGFSTAHVCLIKLRITNLSFIHTNFAWLMILSYSNRLVLDLEEQEELEQHY